MLSLGATGTLTFRNIHRECTSSTELFRCHDLDKLPVAEPRACLGCSWSKPPHFVTFSLHKSPQEFTVCGWDHILKWSRSDKMGRRGQACSQQRSCYKKPGCPVWLLVPAMEQYLPRCCMERAVASSLPHQPELASAGDHPAGPWVGQLIRCSPREEKVRLFFHLGHFSATLNPNS